MFKKFGLPAFVLGTVLTLFGPNTAQAREREGEHHRHRIGVFIGVAPRHYADGYYDRWGYWHPIVPGYYERGRWYRR
jgi:hypothetical protein